jgi:hypothetical protein
LNVANLAKILAAMRSNPRDWRIEDLTTVARYFGMEHRQHGTSHVAFRCKAGILSVPAARPIKPIYVRRFLALVDALQEEK